METYLESVAYRPLSFEPGDVACGTEQGGDMDKATESCRTSRCLTVNLQNLTWRLLSPGGATKQRLKGSPGPWVLK